LRTRQWRKPSHRDVSASSSTAERLRQLALHLSRRSVRVAACGAPAAITTPVATATGSAYSVGSRG
jgi:hypothetical protein